SVGMCSFVRRVPTPAILVFLSYLLLSLASCSGSASDGSEPGAPGSGAPLPAGNAGAGGAFTAMPPGSAPGMGASGATPGGGAAGAAPTAMACPTYVDDFLPRVHEPICSKCHGSEPKLPDWGVYSQAKAACSTIGSRVASGSMPPRSAGTLDADQRAL